ncbi:MAG: hypothetical protein HY303_18525 [Candidatus Wallbacteria bacterium]|nr:hypothetical protein [Candidatus Wallbacteria bacterium]
MRLEILLPWAAFVIPTLLLVLGSLGALFAWNTLAPAISSSDILAEASSPQSSAVTLVIACLLADFALFRWTTGRLVRDLLGGEEVELLYFVGTGISSGRSLGDTLKLAALSFDGDRQLALQLAQVALAIKTGEPAPRSIPAGSACWHIAKAAAILQAGQPDGEVFRDLSDAMQVRRQANHGWLTATVWIAVMFPAILLALPAYVAMLGGPTGPFWSQRILQPLSGVIQALR